MSLLTDKFDAGAHDLAGRLSRVHVSALDRGWSELYHLQSSFVLMDSRQGPVRPPTQSSIVTRYRPTIANYKAASCTDSLSCSKRSPGQWSTRQAFWSVAGRPRDLKMRTKDCGANSRRDAGSRVADQLVSLFLASPACPAVPNCWRSWGFRTLPVCISG